MNTQILDIVSVGMASQILQRHPAAIKAAAKQMGVEPTARINCIDHYDSETLDRIRDHLTKKAGA